MYLVCCDGKSCVFLLLSVNLIVQDQICICYGRSGGQEECFVLYYFDLYLCRSVGIVFMRKII